MKGMFHKRQPRNIFDKVVFGKTLNRFNAPDLDLNEFFRQAWPILEPANPLIPGWHLDLISEYLMLVSTGKVRKLLINMPPRNAKSNLVTILWPVWSWTRYPSLRFVFCSYSSSLAIKHSVDRRRIIESDWFKDNWGGIVRLSVDQNQKQEYENTSRGHMIAASVGGTVTGKGGDVIVEDDMLNPNEADSEAARRHSLDMHKNVLSTRLDNPKTGARVIVEQRTHDKDVSGHVIREEQGWTHLCLPMVAEKKTIISFPVSGKTVEREIGDFLNPERQGDKECEDLKKAMGTRAFVAQCQQNPTSEEGNILKRHWWKHWHVEPESCNVAIQSWDMNFKQTKSGSYVVGQVWKKRGAHFFLMDQFRQRVDFPEAQAAVVTMSGKHKDAVAKLIEDAANGPAIISSLEATIPGIIPIKPLGSKAARAQSVAALVEAGNIHLPDPLTHPWVHDFVEECAAFKGGSGEINDQVDAMTQAVTYLRQLDLMPMYVDDGLGDSFMDTSQYAEVGGFASV